MCYETENVTNSYVWKGTKVVEDYRKFCKSLWTSATTNKEEINMKKHQGHMIKTYENIL